MQKFDTSFFPVYEWTLPKAAIMGGFSLENEKFKCYEQYLTYLSILSKQIKVLYFANGENQKIIQEQIDCSNVQFVDYQLNSIWIRDYAPIWLQNFESKKFKLANFPYGANHFGKSESDDNFSYKLSEVVGLPIELDFPRKQVPFYFDGGNIFVDIERNCFTSIREDDPPLEFRKSLLANINCENIIAMFGIPGEPTGHVDTFLKILPNKKAILAKYENHFYQNAMDKNKLLLEELGYEIIEILHNDNEEKVNWSYVNSVIIDQKVFVPHYGIEQDEHALFVYKKMGYEVIPIMANQIIKENGSLHCITNFIYQ